MKIRELKKNKREIPQEYQVERRIVKCSQRNCRIWHTNLYQTEARWRSSGYCRWQQPHVIILTWWFGTTGCIVIEEVIWWSRQILHVRVASIIIKSCGLEKQTWNY